MGRRGPARAGSGGRARCLAACAAHVYTARSRPRPFPPKKNMPKTGHAPRNAATPNAVLAQVPKKPMKGGHRKATWRVQARNCCAKNPSFAKGSRPAVQWPRKRLLHGQAGPGRHARAGRCRAAACRPPCRNDADRHLFAKLSIIANSSASAAGAGGGLSLAGRP